MSVIKAAADPIDVQNLQFNLLCRLQVFDFNKEFFGQPCNLVSAASRFGLVFVGDAAPNLQVIILKTIEDNLSSLDNKNNYPRRNVALPAPPDHISVNCDHTILAVVYKKDNCPVVCFYDVLSFYKREIVAIKEIRLSPTPGVTVQEVGWNPALSAIFTACKNDGTLGVYELKGNNIDINEIPAASGASCFSWSPKGKQVAVGSVDGKITQYKPDLKAVKVINGPTLQEPHSLISLQWISNYQFVGVFRPQNPDSQNCLIVIDAPKTGDPTFTNYFDVCYSNGCSRPTQFYLLMEHHWNILMVSSSNSMEVGVLGAQNDVWTQWSLSDTARAELPLSENHEDTCPIGFALDTSSTQKIPWGESTIEPAPYLLILSNHGVLCLFRVINLKEGSVSVNSPPDRVADTSGLSLFSAPQTLNVVVPPKQILPPAAPEVKNAFKSEHPVSTVIPQPILNQPPTTPQSSFFANQNINNKPVNFSTPTSLFGKQVPSNTDVFRKSVPPSPQILNPLDKTESSFSIPSTPVKTEIPSLNAEVDDKETEFMFDEMVREECAFLEREVNVSLQIGKGININLGTEEEKNKLVNDIADMEEFIEELVETNGFQTGEIHSLKQNVIQSWAWLEEARSRYRELQDDTISVLLRTKPLDSASEKKYHDIKQLNLYLESQLADANRALDEQWDNFQDQCRKSVRTQMPTMEAIFQTMVKQNAVLQKQSYVLKDISSKLKHKKSNGNSLFVSGNKNDSLLHQIDRLSIHSNDIYKIYREKVLRQIKNVSADKTNILKNILENRELSHISSARPELSNNTFTPVKKTKNIFFNSVVEPVTPLTKFAKPVQPNSFFQSTPLPKSSVESAKETSVFTKSNVVPQKLISSSTNSAFAPTSSVLNIGSNSSINQNMQNTNLFGAHILPKEQVFSAQTIQKPATSLGTSLFGGLTTSAPTKVSASPFSFATVKPPTETTAFGKPTEAFNFNKPASINAPSGPTSNLFAPKTNTTEKQTGFANTLQAKPTQSLFDLGATKTTGTTKAFVDTSSSAPNLIKDNKSTFSFAAPVVAPDSLKAAEPKSQSIFSIGTASAPIFGTKTTPFSGATTSVAPTAISNKPTTVEVPTTKATGLPEMAVPFASTGSSSIFAAPATTTSAPVSSGTTSIFAGASLSSTKTVFTPTTLSATTPKLETPLFGLSSTGTTSVFATATTTAASPLVTTPSNSEGIKTASTSLFGTVGTTTANKSQSGSLFDTQPKTSGSIFATAAKTEPSIFGSTPAPISTVSAFGASASPPVVTQSPFGSTNVGAVSSTQTTPFGTASSTSVFSAAALTKPENTPPFSGGMKSLFGATAATTASIFSAAAVSSTTQASLFEPGATTPSGSLFGTTALTSSGSIFGVNSPASSTSLFGAGTTTTSSIFAAAATTASASIFGAPVATTSASIFGATPATTSASMFGAAPATTSASIFGAPAATTSASIFGAATTTSASIFGATTTSASIFGAAAQPTSGSIFGSTPQTTSSSVFGNASSMPAPFAASPFTTPTSAAPTSPFGQSSPFNIPKTTSSVFAQPPAFGAQTAPTSSTSIFGSSTPITSASTFGQPSSFEGTSIFGKAAPTPGSVFGSPAANSNTFGGGSVFAPASTASGSFGMATSTPGSIFGAATSPTQATSGGGGNFGFGGLNVGSPSTGFGQPAAANPFAKGQSATPFGSTNTAPSGGSIFGTPAQSSFSANTNTSLFGNTSFNSSSNFGGNSSFGQPSAFGNSSFGAQQQQPGPFSGGTSSLSQGGFDTSQAFQKPQQGGFGGSPAFGSAPATGFGAPPTFGGGPTFGSTSPFGSPNKMFGSNQPTNTGFGTMGGNQQNSAFSNLANQNTVGFGNLAQQTPVSQTSTFSGGSSFSSWR